MVSLGQPLRYQPHVAAGVLRSGGKAGHLVAGVYRPLMNPVVGLAGVTAEAYATFGGSFAGAGARALVTSRALGLTTGLDVHLTRPRADPVLSFRTAVRRGGILGRGTMLRLDWLPTRHRTLALSVEVPVMQPLAGRTRARRTAAEFELEPEVGAGARSRRSVAAEPPPAAAGDLAALGEVLEGIRVYGNLYHEDAAVALQRAGSWPDLLDRYDQHLRGALAAAGGERMGEALVSRARSGLLDHVLLPYNRLFGRVKAERGIRSLTAAAHGSFSRWLRDSSTVQAPAHDAVLAVHARWLSLIEAVHARIAARWDDSRSVWLPMHLALEPAQFDEQAEIDSLIGRFVGRPFTDRNALTLLRSGDLPLEIARSVFAARAYHVLWLHDFTGVRERTGAIDLISYEMVADVYLPALTEAVRRYDATGRLPVYMIMLDQFFYEPRNGRLWMSVLEDPLSFPARLPGDNAEREAHLRQRQSELRAAVAASARLQRDAAAGGPDWLRRTVKVHVNITQPSDFSFRSHHIVPPLPFTPDNVMRDHRKIAFYDLDEADPYNGALFLMGTGIGEHYASQTWEDRGFRVRGPAALEARGALRRLLRRHGFSEDDIPPPLREVTSAPRAEERMDLGDYVGRALQVHNEVGWGAKHATVARALLYDLVEPGTIMITPDPIWVSAEWAGMLAGAAARGAQVHVIAPAKENAPTPQGPLLALMHEVTSRLLELSRAVSAAPGGGALRVGLFAAEAQTDDAAGRRREVREGLARAPWITDVIPFDRRALAVLERAETVAATSTDAATISRDERVRPQQLHAKTQLIARPGAVAAFVRQPGWEDALAGSLVSQERSTERFGEQLGYTTPESDETAMRTADALLRGYEQSLSEAERKRMSFYFTLGTQNQDPRGLMLDGEATLVVSGAPAAAGLVDLYYLMARSRWVSTQQELDELLPPPGRFMRWIGRLIRPVY